MISHYLGLFLFITLYFNWYRMSKTFYILYLQYLVSYWLQAVHLRVEQDWEILL
jgi:hypothetical protein